VQTLPNGIKKYEASDNASIENFNANAQVIDDHIGQTNGPHGATSAATPNRIAQRDTGGRIKAAPPVDADDVARKGEVDALESKVGTLSSLLTTAKSSVVTAINELFTLASNGKAAIAAAITGMGQAAAGTDTFAQLAAKIRDISKDATAVAGNILSGKTAYVGGGKVTGTITDHSGATVAVATLNDGTGAKQSYIVSAASNAPSDMAMQIRIKPPAGYYDGNTILDVRLWGIRPDNIRSGDRIFWNDGTALTGSFTSDANATAPQILSGRTAYVNGAKITGTMVNRAGVQAQWSGVSSITELTVHPDAPSDHSKLVIKPGNDGYYDANSTFRVDMFGLVPGNIKAGQVVGYTNGSSTQKMIGTFTADANATAPQILSGRTAYVNGTKVTGTMANYPFQNVAYNAVAGSNGEIYTRINPGAYITTEIRDGKQVAEIYAQDPDFISANIRADKNIFGLQGGIPVKHAGNGDGGTAANHHNHQALSPWSGNALFVKGAWLTGGPTIYEGDSWIKIAEPDFKPENIANGINMFGLVGTMKRSWTLDFWMGHSSDHEGSFGFHGLSLPRRTFTGLGFQPRGWLLIQIPGSGNANISNRNWAYVADGLNATDMGRVFMYHWSNTGVNEHFTGHMPSADWYQPYQGVRVPVPQTIQWYRIFAWE